MDEIVPLKDKYNYIESYNKIKKQKIYLEKIIFSLVQSVDNLEKEKANIIKSIDYKKFLIHKYLIDKINCKSIYFNNIYKKLLKKKYIELHSGKYKRFYYKFNNGFAIFYYGWDCCVSHIIGNKNYYYNDQVYIILKNNDQIKFDRKKYMSNENPLSMCINPLKINLEDIINNN